MWGIEKYTFPYPKTSQSPKTNNYLKGWNIFMLISNFAPHPLSRPNARWEKKLLVFDMRLSDLILVNWWEDRKEKRFNSRWKEKCWRLSSALKFTYDQRSCVIVGKETEGFTDHFFLVGVKVLQHESKSFHFKCVTRIRIDCTLFIRSYNIIISIVYVIDYSKKKKRHTVQPP